MISRDEFLRLTARRAATMAAAFAGGLLIDDTWARLVRGRHLERESYPRLVVGTYRIHHNVVGYILVLMGLFAYPLVLVPMGLGMIVGHRVRDRLLWFVEVESPTREIGPSPRDPGARHPTCAGTPPCARPT